jgi:putative ABC transport system permease protein
VTAERSASAAAYRALLALLPAAFRDRCGDDIEALFLDELRDARARGPWPTGITWGRAAWDVVRRAPYEHWRWRGHRRRKERRMHSIIADLRFAGRSFARQKGATALVLLTLTLAVAANTTVFALLDGLFFRPFPFPAPDRLVNLNEKAPKWNLDFVGVNYPDFETWRTGTHSFSSMALYDGTSVNLADEHGAERVRGAIVTSQFATVLGVRPLLGRMFTAAEDRPNGPEVVVIGYGLWQSRFNGARDVVGRTLRINSRPYQVIGVMPPEADFPGDVRLWLPYQGDPHQPYQSYGGDGVGRLAPGVTVAQARLDLLEAHRRVWRARDTAQVVSPRIEPLRQRFVADFDVMGKALGAGVALVLLIACANVAGAMLARSTVRQREFALRMALGAGARRVARQLLTESLALAAIAGVLGTIVGVWAIRAIAFVAGDQLPQWVHLTFGFRTILFSVVIVALTALLFGLGPALQARRQDARDCLASGSPRGSATRRQRRLLDGLVVVEIALASVLLVAGGLLARTFASLRESDPGFRIEGLATFRVVLPSAQYPDGVRQQAFFESVVERVAALPGVVAAGAVTCPPLSCHQGQFYEAEGGTPSPDGANPVVLTLTSTPGYFATIGAQLAHGHFFAPREGGSAGSTPAVVNESFVRRLWPGVSDPTGRRFRAQGDTSATAWRTVVGVMKDMRHYGLDKPPRPTVVFSTRSMDSSSDRSSFAVVAHASGDPHALFAPMRAIVGDIDRELPMFDVRTMRDAVDASLTMRRMLTLALGGFAVIALTLAVGGIYAVLSYVVGRRRREIGIRMALGAQRGEVVRSVVLRGAGLIGIGLAIGLPVASGAARVIASSLQGVGTNDPLTYLAVAATLGLTGVVAALVPARRAATVEPTTSLADVSGQP